MARFVALALIAFLVACSSSSTATSGDRLACTNVRKANQAVHTGSEDETVGFLSMATAARLADDHRLVQAGQIMQEAANAVLKNDELAKPSEVLAAARIEDICVSLGVSTKATP